MIRTAISTPPAIRLARPALPPTVLPLRPVDRRLPAQHITEPITPPVTQSMAQHRPQAVHGLQRMVGNAAVGHMLGDVRVQRSPDGDLKTLKGEYDNTQDPQRQDQIKRQMEAIHLVKQNIAQVGPPAVEISTSILEPHKINQGQFAFCGPNAFLMAIARHDPVGYVTYLLDLYRAKAAYAGGNAPQQEAHLGAQTVAVSQEIADAKVPLFNQPVGKPGITKTDWMSMASLREDATAKAAVVIDPDVQAILTAFGHNGDVPAALQAAEGKRDKLEQAIMQLKKNLHAGGDTLTAMAQQQPPNPTNKMIAQGTLPSEVAQWFRGYGAQGVVQNADAFTPNKTDQDLLAANALLDAGAGKVVMLNVSTQAAEKPAPNIAHDPLKTHWVLMKTKFVLANNIWECQVDTWGGTRALQIYAADIQNTFFGHVAATIPARPSQFDPNTIK